MQAGVTREQLNAELRGTGLFFPIDPGANATLGGMAATRASGTNAVRYGTMRENVLGLTVVMRRRAPHPHRRPRAQVRRRLRPDAADRRRRGHARASSPRCSCGSTACPEAISAAVCPFDDLAGAVEAVIVAMQHGIPVARIELLDEVQMDACIRYSKLEGMRGEADAVLRVPRQRGRRGRAGRG